MAGYDDIPDGWDIAGWGDSTSANNWFNCEEGDRFPTDEEIMTASQIVVSHLDDDGILHYYSIMDGADGYEGLIDYIDDMSDRYSDAT